jgi:hypothetical protein
MFAKIFGQIFDSSIAEDYNCRRMFMDLLVLADEDGVIDMTYEAIARRTNVPIEDVRKYIEQLCQPDPLSRSKLEEGKRLKILDSNRDWGWVVVNYHHYRNLRDRETLRKYFRDQMRKSRAKRKKDNGVKDISLTDLTTFHEFSPLASASALSVPVQETLKKWIGVRTGQGKKPKRGWVVIFQEQIKFLQQHTEADQLVILEQSIRNDWRGLFPPKRPQGSNGKEKLSAFEIKTRLDAIEERLGKTEYDKDKPEVANERRQLFARRKELKGILLTK